MSRPAACPARPAADTQARASQEFDEFSSEGVFSVSVSANDLVGPRKYFVSVKCRLAAAKFRILPMLTESELLLGDARRCRTSITARRDPARQLHPGLALIGLPPKRFAVEGPP